MLKLKGMRGIILAAFILCSSLILLSGFSRPAASDLYKYRYYTTVRVHRGDTLYSIAESYMPGRGVKMNAYIREIMDLNHLVSSVIYTGQQLVVPYYSDEYK